MLLSNLESEFGYAIDRHIALVPYREGTKSLDWCPMYGTVTSYVDGHEHRRVVGPPCVFEEEWLESGLKMRTRYPDAAFAPSRPPHQHICLSCPREREERHAEFHEKPPTITQHDTLTLLLALTAQWKDHDVRCEVEDCRSRKSKRDGDSDAAHIWHDGKYRCYLCRCDLHLDPEWRDALFPIDCELPHPEAVKSKWGIPKAESLLRFGGGSYVKVCRMHATLAKRPIQRLESPGAV